MTYVQASGVMAIRTGRPSTALLSRPRVLLKQNAHDKLSSGQVARVAVFQGEKAGGR